jgi:hypothetical protein
MKLFKQLVLYENNNPICFAEIYVISNTKNVYVLFISKEQYRGCDFCYNFMYSILKKFNF